MWPPDMCSPPMTHTLLPNAWPVQRSAFKPFTLLALLQSIKRTTTEPLVCRRTLHVGSHDLSWSPRRPDRYRPSRRWLIHVTLRARTRPCLTMLIAFGDTSRASEQNFPEFSKANPTDGCRAGRWPRKADTLSTPREYLYLNEAAAPVLSRCNVSERLRRSRNP